jgi:hypothetical protein
MASRQQPIARIALPEPLSAPYRIRHGYGITNAHNGEVDVCAGGGHASVPPSVAAARRCAARGRRTDDNLSHNTDLMIRIKCTLSPTLSVTTSQAPQ